MVFIGAAEPSTLSTAIHVPETYPADSDLPPFNPKEVVRIRTNAKFDDFYEIYGEPLGEGKFGKVFQCRERSTGLELAAKFIKIRKDADKATVEREVSIMTQMRHPRIAQIYDAFYAGTNDVILLMEIVRGGELFNRVAEESYILTEKAVAMIVCQICEAIDYIHSQHIIHLDIKPENIMCVSETGNRIKLIDFGLAQYYDGSKDLYYMAGTPEFAAPEVIKYEPLDFRTDMWSVGVITYILLSGYSPFLGDNVAETYVNVERGEWEFTEEFELVSEQAKDFIRNLLSYDKNNRMYPRECLKHPWIAETRAAASIDTLLAQPIPIPRVEPIAKEAEPAIEDGTQLSNKQIKRYVVRRRFRKLAFAVMCYVDFRKILIELRRRHSIKGEEYFAAAKVPDPPEEMGALLAKKPRDEEIASASTSEKKESTSDETMDEKVVKKKKKTSTTTSSGAERPKTKKAKKEESPDESAVFSPSEEETVKDKTVQKKRMKKDATSMATSSQEKPAKIVKKSSSDEFKVKRRVSKSPSPIKVGVIPEETKPKKKSIKPASSDSGVVVDSKMRQTSMDRESVVSRKSEMTLSPPESIAEKKVKKTKKSSSAAVPTENEAKQSKQDGEKATEKKTKSIVATRLAQISRTESSPLKMPVIHIQPPTPATNSTAEKKKIERVTSPLTIKIPSPSTSSLASPLSNAPTSGISSPSTETLQVEEKKRKTEEDKQKKRVWKQEKYEASESRRSTEVISVPKNQLPSTVDAEKAAAVKKKAQSSPLAERIARMENMAKEKQIEQEVKRGRLKIERENSGLKSVSKESSPAPPSKISIVSEKATTTTKTTTVNTRNKTEEKEVGSSVSTGKSKIEVRDKSEKETNAVKVNQTEVSEERSQCEETPKKTVKKTMVKKTSTTTTTEKEKKIKRRSESIESSMSALVKSDKNDLEVSSKLVTNGTTVADGEMKIGVENKKKLRVEKNDEGKNRVEATEKEVTTVQIRDKETKEKVKKTSMTTVIADASNTSNESTPTKKKTKPKVLKEKEVTPPFIEYPPALADDIQRLKEARAKAKKKEEELQHRHVRFADEPAFQEKPEPQVKVNRSTKIEHSSEEERKGEEKKTRRKSSFFEITDEEKDKLESLKEDFSFASLRHRLEKQLSKKGSDDSEDDTPPPEPKKEVIVCPSTNSLLKRWKNIEQTNC
ncbi:hypothetical protein PFISCL1PPCAC_27512 [Pristionchus fissidentatus]|uniref:Protein kinase domain-containing protein n=1 Tax=Pristionchus fissidentatus TaxID=1538716 RepID=A0AAV5WXJ1_9BILA|nr:hypothetical protein PFISCL1PPCAC_27512 [Pristionchus fissidentatus]